MKQIAIPLIFALAATIFAISCGEKSNSAALPSISGKAGEIGVIATKGQWEADPGNAIRNVLSADFPYIPQKEPRYRLFNVPEENFTKVFQVHRNLIFLRIEDTCSVSMSVRRDIWASPQTMLTITAPDDKSAAQYINDNGKAIIGVFENAERNRVIRNAMAYPNRGLEEQVKSVFGGTPYIPSSYTLKKYSPDFFWISYETTYTNQGIFIYKFPYTGESQFIPKYLVEKRDTFLKENVPATTEGSYMITNPAVVPGFEWKKYNGREFAELRSLWDTHNDFMGGPFISDAFLSPDGKNVIVTEAFVYAPKYDKRDYLRQTEAIIYSWHWNEE